MVILNGTDKQQILPREKYREALGDAVSGKEIISGMIRSIPENIIVSPKAVYIIELM